MRLHPDARAAFCRFRDTGDTAAMAQVFDLVAQELLLVACHVAGRGQQPEDLLQETFLHAIEKAERYDASRPLEPWLLGILVNVARSDRRRRSREQQAVDPHELAAAPSDPVLENALAASVQAAIRAIPLPQREVMTLHLVHGMTSTEIAHATGRPIGSVKSWLHRGLAVVRRRLPVALTTAFAALLRGMQGTARLREVVLRAAEAGPMAARAAVAAAQRGTGAAIAHTRMAAYVGLGTALAVPLLLWFSSPGSVARSDVAAVDDVPAATALADDARTSEPSEPGPPPPPQRTLVAEPQPTCSLTVVGKPTGEPFAFGAHFLVPWLPDPHLQRVAFATDDTGVYTMNGMPFGTYALVADRGQLLTVTIDRPQQTVEVPIADGADVAGRVVDADGRGVPGARIWLSTKRLDERGNAAVADGDGAFVVRDVPAGWHLSAAHTGHVPSALHTVAGDATQPIELRLAGPSASISFEVVDPSGAPVANAILLCGTGLGPTGMVNHGGIPTRLPSLCATNERGAVVCTELPRGAAAHVFVRAPQFAAVEREIAATDAATDEPRTVRIVLPRGGTVRGRLLAANGAPVPGLVTAHTASARPARMLPRWCVPTCLAGADGNFCLVGIAAGRTTLRAAGGGSLLATTEIDVAEGSQHEWSPTIGGDAVRGIVRSADGVALAGYRVQAETSGARIAATAAADGTFVLNGLPDGAVELRVLPPDERARFVLCRSFAAERPRADTVLTVPIARLATATVRGTLLGFDDAARASLVAASGGVLDARVDADGSFTAGPLPADTYHLVVGEHTVVLHREVVLASSAVVDLGTIHPDDPAVVTVTSGAATAAAPCELRVLTDDGAAMLGYGTLRGAPCEVRVPPGPCQFHLRRNGDLVAARRVELASGPLSLDLAAATGTMVLFSAAPATPTTSLRVMWDIEGPGSRVQCATVRPDELPAEAAAGLCIVLPEGEYSVRASADSGETATARVHVSPSAGPASQNAPPLRLQ